MYDKDKNYKKVKKYRLIIIVLLISLLAGATSFFILRNNSNESSSSVNSNDGSEIDSEINFDPPTEEESIAGNDQKEDLADNVDENQPVSSAEVVIVDASQYNDIVEVRAFVSNLISDGTCIVTFSKDGDSFSKETSALPDASTTTCITNDVELSEFSKSGVWDVEVRYNGNGVSGASNSTVEVQL